MRIAVGSDHRGVELRAKLIEFLRQLGQEVVDVGTHDRQDVDYPDIAAAVARKVGGGEVDRGILVCGTGVGMCIVANKVPGVRAAPCHDDITAEMSRRHNDLNVLCLSGDLIGERLADRLVEIWLKTPVRRRPPRPPQPKNRRSRTPQRQVVSIIDAGSKGMAVNKQNDIRAIFRDGTLIDEAMNAAVRDAVQLHKEKGLPLVVEARRKNCVDHAGGGGTGNGRAGRAGTCHPIADPCPQPRRGLAIFAARPGRLAGKASATRRHTARL